MSTSIPWFRYGVRELLQQIRRAKTPYARALWVEALHRARRLREKHLRSV